MLCWIHGLLSKLALHDVPDICEQAALPEPLTVGQRFSVVES